MTKQVLLHIGLPKTATSRIQTALHENHDALAAAGVQYLKSPQHPLFHDNGHHILAVDLMERDWEAMQLHLREEEIRRAWELAIDEIESASVRTSIISSEWFAFGIHAETQFMQLKEKLARFEVHVVVALRDVVGFANSLYAQRVRDGFAGSPADFVTATWSLLNWSDLTNRWASVFGANSILAINFDTIRKTSEPASEFLRHTLKREVMLTVPNDALVNQTLPKLATDLMREVNLKVTDDSAKVRFRNSLKIFFEEHGAAFQPGSYFSEDAQVMMRRHCVWPHTVN